MKTASTIITPATDGQYGEAKTMFERTLRATVSDKDAVQRVLGRWDKIGPAIAPILLRYSADRVLVDSDLLRPVAMATLPGCTVTPSALKDGVNTIGGKKIKLWLGSNAESLLRGYAGEITAEPVENARIHQLKKGSVDGSILEVLGGEEVARFSLANLIGQMLEQEEGQSGMLLTNGYANICYIEEFPLWAFDCCWHSSRREWCLDADPVARRSEWRAGCQVLSH